VDKTRGQLEDIRSRLVRGVRRKGALARWLLELDAWDLFLAVFGECHRGGHLLWPEADPGSAIPRDALLDVYRAVDAELQQLAAALPRGAGPLILFSLHGMEANRSQEHFVPRLMDRINAGFRGETLPSMAPPAEQRSLMRYLRGALPARLQNAVAQAVPVGVRDWVVSRAVAGGYDWGRTPGFALLADSNGYVRLNLVGRERDGCLDTPELRGRYAHWLRDRFLGLRVGAAGEPLVREVVATRSVFPGTRCDFLPDFVVTWEDAAPATCVQSEALGTIEARLETGRSGNHRHAGFCVSLRRGGAPPCPPEHIQDLAPLAQELLGIR
jgi:predicted AlkP superfamily phosphohydrolase/phosphomutase